MLKTREDIENTVHAFYHSRIILTAFELDVFTIIGRNDKRSADVAKEAGTDPRATDRLLNALCALGLMNKTHDKFSNTELAAKYLSKGSPLYFKGLGHALNMYNSWTTLTDAVREGKSVYWDPGLKDENYSYEGFISAMHERGLTNAKELAEKLDLTDVRRVLDVGGGSGVYSMAFARANNSLRSTVFDKTHVIEITQSYIKDAGMEDRIDTMGGDYYTDDFGNGYDLVLFSAILHINTPGQNRTLLRKAAGALNPEGRIIIQDFIMDEDRVHPHDGAIFALHMIVNADGGDTYTVSEISAWLNEAGCGKDIQHIPFGESNSLIIARKDG